MKKAKDIMTKSPATCRVQDTIYDAVRIMKDKDCGVVPIVDERERCVGIVTDRDICLYTVLHRKAPESTPVGEVMTNNVFTCRADDDIDAIINKMERQKVRRIPVVDKDDHCIGIIAQADIALVDRKRASELVDLVSR
jgi:CBS domain-containing protein